MALCGCAIAGDNLIGVTMWKGHQVKMKNPRKTDWMCRIREESDKHCALQHGAAEEECKAIDVAKLEQQEEGEGQTKKV